MLRLIDFLNSYNFLYISADIYRVQYLTYTHSSSLSHQHHAYILVTLQSFNLPEEKQKTKTNRCNEPQPRRTQRLTHEGFDTTTVIPNSPRRALTINNRDSKL